MIIVYFDSEVQTAFEELVKFLSGSRNAMRKGKMAWKMAEMRRAAELEVDIDEYDDDGDGGLDSLDKNNGALELAAL
jgi:CTP:phosphocholine cytidylyltransferase-like protein